MGATQPQPTLTLRPYDPTTQTPTQESVEAKLRELRNENRTTSAQLDLNRTQSRQWGEALSKVYETVMKSPVAYRSSLLETHRLARKEGRCVAESPRCVIRCGSMGYFRDRPCRMAARRVALRSRRDRRARQDGTQPNRQGRNDWEAGAYIACCRSRCAGHPTVGTPCSIRRVSAHPCSIRRLRSRPRYVPQKRGGGMLLETPRSLRRSDFLSAAPFREAPGNQELDSRLEQVRADVGTPLIQSAPQHSILES